LCLAALAFIFVPYYFAQDFERQQMALVLLVVAPVLVAIASWLARLSLSAPARQTIAITVWSILISFFLFDLYLRVRIQNTETHAQRVVRERGTDPSATAPIFPRLLAGEGTPPGSFALRDRSDREFFPLADVSNSTIVYCRESGDWTIYRSDEKGFHNPQGIWSHPVDIAMLGPSHVQGACVPSGSDWVAGIRRRYPATLNFGRGSNGPLSGLAILTEYAAVAKPKLVLWVWVDSDFRNLAAERMSRFLTAYLEDGYTQNLAARTAEIDPIVRAYIDRELVARLTPATPQTLSIAFAWETGLSALSFPVVRDLLLKPHFGRHDLAMTPEDYEEENQDWPLLEKILVTAKRRAESWGARMALIGVPFQDPEGYRDPDTYPPAREFLARRVAMAAKLGLPYHDLNDEFRKLANPNIHFADLHRYYGHENELGYRVMADATVKFMEEIAGDFGLGAVKR
jgi:hypothetical protein